MGSTKICSMAAGSLIFLPKRGNFTQFALLLSLICIGLCAKGDEGNNANEKWKKKNVRDYTDADLERLFDQWEDNDDEELPEDELPEWKRPQPKVDISKLDPNDPEAMLKESKKQRTLMMFATVSGNPTEAETEQITQLWQSSLFNAHYEMQRYVVGSNRVLFMLKDGSKAWEIKSFLVTQERCELVTIEGQDFPGKGASADTEKKPNPEENKTKKPKKKKKTEESKKKRQDSENEINRNKAKVATPSKEEKVEL